MLFEIQSAKTLEQVCQDLEKAVRNHKFGVMTVHNLKETMKKNVHRKNPSVCSSAA